MDVRFCEGRNHRREAHVRAAGSKDVRFARSSVARVRRTVFPLDNDLHGWSATWTPDYQQNGTVSGLQIYKVDLEGDTAVVFCLVGATRKEVIDGTPRNVWRGSHVRDTWIKTSAGWK